MTKEGDDEGRGVAYIHPMPDPREAEPILDPKYDAAGLVTAVVTDRAGALLMVAHMTAEALAATQEPRATNGAACYPKLLPAQEHNNYPAARKPSGSCA